MKLSNEQLVEAIEHAGYDYDPDKERILIPVEDYDFENPKHSGYINLKIKDSSQFDEKDFDPRKYITYVVPRQLGDICKAIANADGRGYTTLVIFIET